MRFSRVHDLKGSRVFRNLTQSIKIGENQIRALVAGGSPRKSDGELLGIKLQAGLLAHDFQKFMLGNQVGGPDFFGREPQRAAEAVIVFTPRGYVAIEELPERGSR